MIDKITYESMFEDFEDVYELRRDNNKNDSKDSCIEKLLPCPYCGNSAWVVKTKSYSYFIQCVKNCTLENMTRRYFSTEKLAIEEWNRRER